MIVLKKTLISTAAILLLGACSGEKGTKKYHWQSREEVKADRLIKHSFKPVSQKVDHDQGSVYNISISKEALEKEFLFQGSLINQLPAPNFHGLKSRVVAFKKVGDEIFLLEATQGHIISEYLPQEIILAKFPIMNEDEQNISFDFNAGMSKLFYSNDWRAVDFEGDYYNGDSWNHLYLDNSYVKEVSYTQKQQVSITQVAQVQQNVMGNIMNFPVMVKYYLSPYEPNEDFVPFPMNDMQQVGYFNIAPQKNTDDEMDVTYATLFHPEKQISYYISANTPEDYVEAVKDGVLYWNKIFGEEKITVKVAPEGVSAPNYNYNMVQWVKWDTAGGAYADAQMDPRTGEIHHAQIFMTSAFAFGGRHRARLLLTRLKEQFAQTKGHGARDIKLKGLSSSKLCDFHMNQQFAQSLQKILLDQTLSDEAILKISQDYVREVVAHEVGHTLGLRHNFAGSLRTENFSQMSKNSIYTQYLTMGEAPADVRTTSSVMEYQQFIESTLSGDFIKRGNQGFSYDHKAINVLYKGQKLEEKQTPYFCTDSDVGLYLDCNRFDSGLSGINYVRWEQKNNLEKLAHTMLENYISAKMFGRSKNNLKNLSHGTMSPWYVAYNLLEGRNRLLKYLSPELKLIQVRRNHPLSNTLDEKDLQKEERDLVKQQIADAGGLTELLGTLDMADVQKQINHFKQLLKKEGPMSALHDWEFTEEEVNFMLAESDKLMKQLEETFVEYELTALSNEKTLSENELNRELISVLSDRMKEIVFATSEKTIEAKLTKEKMSDDGEVEVEEVEVSLPLFKYPYNLRVMATSLLDKSVTGKATFAEVYKEELQKQFEEQIKEHLRMELHEFEGYKQSDFVKENVFPWVKENQALLALMG